MARVKSTRKKPGKHNIWRSYSDMMCGLLMLFVLIMCVTLFQAQKSYVETLEEQKSKMVIQNEYDRALLEKQQEVVDQASTIREQDTMLADLQKRLEDQNLTLGELEEALNEQALLLDQKTIALSEKEDELNSKTLELKGSREQIDNIIGVKAEVIAALKEEFDKSGTTVNIDPETGAMVLSSNIMFGYNEDILTEDGKEVLDGVLPTYCKVLLKEEYLPYLAEIIIDGYTDTDGSYEYNLGLSQKRSLAVANHLLSIASEFLDDNGLETLKSKLTVNGHSMNNPILDDKGEIDAEKSRRVEIKFRLKDEEMISSLFEILRNSEILDGAGEGVKADEGSEVQSEVQNDLTGVEEKDTAFEGSTEVEVESETAVSEESDVQESSSDEKDGES